MLPIFRTLLRNKGTFLLMTLQISITLAVLINALALVQRSREIIQEPTGMEDVTIIAIRVVPFAQAFNDESYGEAQLRRDLDYLRSQPGVINASISNSFPGDLGSNSSIYQSGKEDSRDGPDVGVFVADEALLETLGVDVIAGRNFRAEEIFFSDWPPADKEVPQLIILTEDAANEVFPDGDALGKSVWINGTTRTVVGITDTYQGRNAIMGDAGHNAFLPGYISGPRQSSNFLVRADPTRAAALMKTLEAGLLELNDGRDVEQVRLVSELLARGKGLYSYGGIVLMTISALLVFTTALGIFGVAFFSVTKRTCQIGTRRALGATKTDIMKFFFIENLITTGTGIILGSVAAIGLNIVMTQLGLGRADWLVTGLGIVFVLLVGQMSVLLPAYKAAQIEPAIATRA